MVFTGIVEGTGIISKIARKENLSTITVGTPFNFNEGIQVGASVCVDGVCLTVLFPFQKGKKKTIASLILMK
jgi:riboflavin synthase